MKDETGPTKRIPRLPNPTSDACRKCGGPAEWVTIPTESNGAVVVQRRLCAEHAPPRVPCAVGRTYSAPLMTDPCDRVASRVVVLRVVVLHDLDGDTRKERKEILVCHPCGDEIDFRAAERTAARLQAGT